MTASIRYDENRAAHVVEGAVGLDKFRLVVPRDFLDDEIGSDATADARDTWIENNLPDILSAYTARSGGGRVNAPWNRILVEEIS